MDDLAFAYLLQAMLDGDDGAFEEMNLRDTRSFHSAGLLTMNNGVVARLMDGSEFQITVVRSRGPA